MVVLGRQFGKSNAGFSGRKKEREIPSSAFVWQPGCGHQSPLSCYFCNSFQNLLSSEPLCRDMAPRPLAGDPDQCPREGPTPYCITPPISQTLTKCAGHLTHYALKGLTQQMTASLDLPPESVPGCQAPWQLLSRCSLPRADSYRSRGQDPTAIFLLLQTLNVFWQKLIFLSALCFPTESHLPANASASFHTLRNTWVLFP